MPDADQMSDTPGSPPTAGSRRLGRWLLRAVLVVMLAVLCAETALQLASLASRGRSELVERARRHRVLCVGDSHTYGAGVPESDTYPARLQAELDALEPGAYAVANRGVPGFSTAQVLNRLPRWVEDFQPDTLVVWAGVNDAWNDSEIGGGTAAKSWLHAIADRSKLYRMYRVWRHDQRMAKQVDPVLEGETRPRRFRTETSEDGKYVRDAGARRTVTIYWDDGMETMDFDGAYREADPESARRAEENYEAIARYAADAGLRLVFITYPIPVQGFEFANRSMRRVAERHGATVVDSAAAMARVPADQLEWVAIFHPTRPLYTEIARDVAAAIRAEPRAPSQP
jgi:lysophospholipase L1-like esterase